MSEPIRSSLMKPVLIFGCEWKPFGLFCTALFSSCMTAFPRIRGAFDFIFFIAIVVIGAVGVVGLRALAKSDPQYFGIFLRSRRYPKFIKATSTPFLRDIDYSKAAFGYSQTFKESAFS